MKRISKEDKNNKYVIKCIIVHNEWKNKSEPERSILALRFGF
jgi:hypothetical protein